MKDDDDDFVRVGHELYDAAARTSFKNGELATLREAVNNCVEHWMVGDVWAEDDERWIALDTWLKEQSQKSTDNLTYEIVQPPSDLSGGDVTEGMKLFNKTCAACHGADAVGTERGPALAGTELSREKMAERIRLSGPTDTGVYDDLTGGRMPFWAKDRLSDAQMIDLIAFIEATEPIDNANGSDADISVANAQDNCASDHPSVGKTASLSTFSHKVAGTVKVVDNCTIEISNFVFDGGGIDVRIYSGDNRDFDSGQAISKDIFGTAYDGETVTMKLPQGVSLDDFDSISVWCVAVGQDFGNAKW